MGKELNLLAMRDHATMLAAASRRLVEDRPTGDGRDEVEVFPLAALVMSALATKIAMKALISRGQGFATVRELGTHVGRAHGHDMEHLFRLLPASSQRYIRRRIEASRPKHWAYITLVKQEALEALPDARRASLLTNGFEAELKLLGKPFERWRYGYEQSLLICNTTFLELLMDATLDAVRVAIRAGRAFR